MKWSTFLGTMSPYLQKQKICDSEIMSERIRFYINFRIIFFLTVPLEERVICMKEISF